MSPAQVHSWKFSPNTKGIIIEFQNISIFSKEGDYQLFEMLINRLAPFQQLKDSEFNSLNTLFKMIIDEYETKSEHFEVGVRSFLSNILLMMARLKVPTKYKSHQNSFIEDFNFLLEEHYRVQHEIEFYAKKLKINPKSLSEKIKRLTGFSARNIIQERCLLEAKRLLAYSDLTINEISEIIGYLNPSYFARLFKLKTKLTPGDFRQNVKHHC